MIDSGESVRIARLFGELPAIVWVTHYDMPTLALRPEPEPVVLALREDQHPDAVRWPDLSGIEVRAVTDGMVPAVAARLVAVLLDAGAGTLHEYSIVETVPCLSHTHAGGRS